MTSLLYPTTNLESIEQLIIERGEGVYVYDNKGRKYLEGLAGLWCTALGYGNQEVIDAISEQLKTVSYTHLFGGKSHQPGITLAEKLAEMVPVDRAKIFFGNSGSDANDTHIKVLRYYYNAIGKPKKRKIITREKSYHGVTVGSGCFTTLEANLLYFDNPIEALGILRTDSPHYYHNHHDGETEDQFVERIIQNLEELILKENPDTIGAMILEPITGASGIIVPPPGYYEKLQPLLKKYDILLIADEVINGFGRTGSVFGCSTMGIQPDIMTLAKQLSSAYFPISASVYPLYVHDALVKLSSDIGIFGHGFTYSGHPVGCAAALKTIEIMERDHLFQHAATVGEHFQQRLREFECHPLVGEVRGRGLLAGVELVADKDTKASFKDGIVATHIQQACQDNGLIVRMVAGSTVALCPPLIITIRQVNEIIDKLGIALNQTLEFVHSRGLLEK